MQMPAHQNAQPIGFITQQPQPQAQPTTFQAPYYSPYPTPYPPNNPVMSSQITQPATQIILPPQLTNSRQYFKLFIIKVFTMHKILL